MPRPDPHQIARWATEGRWDRVLTAANSQLTRTASAAGRADQVQAGTTYLHAAQLLDEFDDPAHAAAAVSYLARSVRMHTAYLMPSVKDRTLIVDHIEAQEADVQRDPTPLNLINFLQETEGTLRKAGFNRPLTLDTETATQYHHFLHPPQTITYYVWPSLRFISVSTPPPPAGTTSELYEASTKERYVAAAQHRPQNFYSAEYPNRLIWGMNVPPSANLVEALKVILAIFQHDFPEATVHRTS